MSQAQEVYGILTEIDKLLADIELKIQRIEQGGGAGGTGRGLELTLSTFRQLERVALRYLAIMRMMGLPEDVDRAIGLFSRLIVIVRMAQMTVNMFMATTPIGWVQLAAGSASALMTGMTMAETAQSWVEGY